MAPWSRKKPSTVVVRQAPHISREKSLLGAATVLGYDPAKLEAQRYRGPHPWQEEVWAYFDSVGEVNNTGRYIANSMSRIVMQPGWEDDNGKVVALTDKTKDLPDGAKAYIKPAQELIRNLRSRSGGQSQLLSDLGYNLSLPAECYLVHTDETVGGVVKSRQWEVLSTSELRPKPDGSGYLRHRGIGWPPEELPANAHPVRIWLKHPRYSQMPMSAIRPLLDGIEELVLLRREVRGQTISQIASVGILFMPQEINWPTDPSVPDSEAGSPMQYLLGAAMGAGIGDKGSANAQIPLCLDVPADLIEKFRFMDFRSPADAQQIAKRTEALEAYARGAPLPVEVTTGHMSTTFANAGQIDEDTYKAYIEPFARGAIDSIVVGYLHPQLLIAAGMDPTSTPPELMQRVSIFPDLSELLAPKDTTQQALDAHDRYIICNATLARELGFSEDDKPTDEEILARVRIKQMGNSRETLRGMVSTSAEDSLIAPDPNASTARPPMTELPPPDSALPSKKPVDPDKREDDPEPPAVAPPAPGAPPTQEVDVSGVPTPVPAAEAEGGTQASAATPQQLLCLQVAISVEQAVARAMDKAGATLKNRTNGRLDPEMTAAVKRSDRHLVASVLGPAKVAEFMRGDDLFAGEWDALRRTMTAAASMVMDQSQAEAIANRAVELAEHIAKARIGDPSRKPSSEQLAYCVTGR